MANYLGVSVNEYLKHESGEIDSSFTFLYHCAQRFEIDISELVEGRSPHLSFFDVNYSGSGMPIQRREGFTYLHLA